MVLEELNDWQVSEMGKEESLLFSKKGNVGMIIPTDKVYMGQWIAERLNFAAAMNKKLKDYEQLLESGF